MSILDRRLLGALEERLGESKRGRSFDSYAGRPVDFAVEVLGMTLLRWQRAWLDAFHAHRQHCVVSGNGCGKTVIVRALLIYVAVVLAGTALYLSASERQTRSQQTGRIKALLAATPAIVGNAYVFGCEFDGGGTIVFLARGEMSALQGYHSEGRALLIVCDESQALEPEHLSALQGCAVGEADRLVLLGNPLSIGTPFYRVAVGVDPSWHRVKVTAFDIFDDSAATQLSGLVTKAGIDALRQQWGEMSAVFQARAWANFPTQPADALFPEAAIQAAFARYRDGDFESKETRRKLVLGVDCGASEDGDETVVCVSRGGYVRELVTWRESDTMRSVGKVIDVLRRLLVNRRIASAKTEARFRASPLGNALLDRVSGDPLEYGGIAATIRCDEIGVGKGISDRLAEAGYRVEPFNSSRKPTKAEDYERYANARAAAYGRLRTLLVQGKVALPPDPLLEEELRTAQAFTNSSGKLQILSKKEWREMIGRSPDRLDSVCMALGADAPLDLTGIPAFALPIA